MVSGSLDCSDTGPDIGFPWLSFRDARNAFPVWTSLYMRISGHNLEVYGMATAYHVINQHLESIQRILGFTRRHRVCNKHAASGR